MVDNTISFALENLSRLLADEVKLLSGVEDQVTSLSNELRFMDIFLKSSEGKQNNDLVKEVVNQVRDVANQAEDVVDTYVVNVNKNRSRNMLGKCFHCKNHVIMLHEVNDQIKTIKDKINDIYQNKTKYGIGEGDFVSGGNNEKEIAQSLRMRRRDVEEEEVVGLVHDSSVVINHLMAGNSSRRVVSITGMGGLGKSTLARKIYNEDKVKDIFPCRAWGFVSNDYRAQEFLLGLLQCLGLSTGEYKDLNRQDMKRKVREWLTRKKYLVVLDDIWKTQVWDELQEVFPDDNNSSRILITTRMREITSYTRATFTYNLPFLDESQSWELFCKKVFCREKCPYELEPLGRTMTERCKGLPLAIIVLAGMVAKKDRSPREWHKIKDYVTWHLAQEDNTIVKDILKLSYDDLPQRLKPCFLYLGIYPEDYEIPVRQLLQMWIAEGFIQPKETGTTNAPELEHVADNYLDKLVERSLVQVASWRSDGGVKTCRIHDLIRDLCISESKANKFMELCTELDIDNCNPRRMSLHCKTELSPTKYNQSQTRSLFLFGEFSVEWDGKSKEWKWIRKRLKLARVLNLNLSVVWLYSPLSGLKTLIHLRYLKIKASDSETGNNILAYICNLWNLETLHLMCRSVVTLPSGMWKLKRLRHICIKEVIFGQESCMSRGKNIETMVNLQTLGGMGLNTRIASILNKVPFPNLTKLGLVGIWAKKRPQQEQLRRSMHCLNKLRTLKLERTSDPPLDANAFPSNLTKITLRACYGLDSRFINTLGQLAKLQTLKLHHVSTSGSVNCTAGEFLQLEVFHMQAVEVKGWWRQEKGAMPLLRLHTRLYSQVRFVEWDEQEQRCNASPSTSHP